MNQSKKPKTSSDDDSSASSSSSSGDNHRPEIVKKEPNSPRKIQKADREKIRRDKLNEQFLELGNALDPKRPKSDKASILSDTIQMLKNLMSQVDRLKAEHATLSQESRELIQEKRELREEKATLKSDIEILNSQYQERVRKTMVPWIPHYTYPIPVVAITRGPLASIQQPSSSSSSGVSNKQVSTIKSSDHKDGSVGLDLELELKINGSSSSAQQDVCGKEKKGSSATTTTAKDSSHGIV